MSEKQKPCKWCGRPFTETENQFACACGQEGPHRPTDSEEITAWNTRPPLPAPPEGFTAKVYVCSEEHRQFLEQEGECIACENADLQAECERLKTLVDKIERCNLDSGMCYSETINELCMEALAKPTGGTEL